MARHLNLKVVSPLFALNAVNEQILSRPRRHKRLRHDLVRHDFLFNTEYLINPLFYYAACTFRAALITRSLF